MIIDFSPVTYMYVQQDVIPTVTVIKKLLIIILIIYNLATCNNYGRQDNDLPHTKTKDCIQLN